MPVRYQAAPRPDIGLLNTSTNDYAVAFPTCRKSRPWGFGHAGAPARTRRHSTHSAGGVKRGNAQRRGLLAWSGARVLAVRASDVARSRLRPLAPRCRCSPSSHREVCNRPLPANPPPPPMANLRLIDVSFGHLDGLLLGVVLSRNAGHRGSEESLFITCLLPNFTIMLSQSPLAIANCESGVPCTRHLPSSSSCLLCACQQENRNP